MSKVNHIRHRKKANDLINERKIDGCSVCGYKKCFEALDFHHTGGKDANISHIRDKNLEKLKMEIDKCIVLCANCHREIHSNTITKEAQ